MIQEVAFFIGNIHQPEPLDLDLTHPGIRLIFNLNHPSHRVLRI